MARRLAVLGFVVLGILGVRELAAQPAVPPVVPGLPGIAPRAVPARAQDRDRWNGLSRYIAVARPDQEGRFRLRTLPPGDYYAVAVESIEQCGWMDPDVLESFRHAAVSLSMNPGETRTVDLPLMEPR